MIGDVFIDNVKTEETDEGINLTTHPIENNKQIADHIEKRPVVLSLTGIVTGKDAFTRLEKLRKYMHSGTKVTFTYRSVYKNMLITDIPISRVIQVKDGFTFSFTLQQARIASVGTVKKGQPKNTQPVTNKGRQQTTGAATKVYTVKSGDNLTKIAGIYKVNVTKLYEKNRGIIGSNKDLIRPGQKLVIPS